MLRAMKSDFGSKVIWNCIRITKWVRMHFSRFFFVYSRKFHFVADFISHGKCLSATQGWCNWRKTFAKIKKPQTNWKFFRLLFRKEGQLKWILIVSIAFVFGTVNHYQFKPQQENQKQWVFRAQSSKRIK